MKKVNLTGKLSLKKETIAKLNEDQLSAVKGGAQLTARSECVCIIYISKGGTICDACNYQ